MQGNNSASVYNCKYHIIFCPKYRRSVLVNGVDEELKKIVLELGDGKGYTVLEMRVMPNYVYLLLDCSPDLAPIEIVKNIKKQSAMRLKKEFPWLIKKLPCLWTRNTFISTVGTVSEETAKEYIDSQKNK